MQSRSRGIREFVCVAPKEGIRFISRFSFPFHLIDTIHGCHGPILPSILPSFYGQTRLELPCLSPLSQGPPDNGTLRNPSEKENERREKKKRTPIKGEPSSKVAGTCHASCMSRKKRSEAKIRDRRKGKQEQKRAAARHKMIAQITDRYDARYVNVNVHVHIQFSSAQSSPAPAPADDWKTKQSKQQTSNKQQNSHPTHNHPPTHQREKVPKIFQN